MMMVGVKVKYKRINTVSPLTNAYQRGKKTYMNVGVNEEYESKGAATRNVGKGGNQRK